jgi:hypothetical protein
VALCLIVAHSQLQAEVTEPGAVATGSKAQPGIAVKQGFKDSRVERRIRSLAARGSLPLT